LILEHRELAWVPTVLLSKYCSGLLTTLYPCNPMAIQFSRLLSARVDVKKLVKRIIS
jgi:hypothetical protein